MYDLIGDIHGHATALKKLLLKMDYTEVDHVWQHTSRKVIFVGDYIDRGPAIRETLQIVRRMTENDKAIALMGNHEYNALAYHYPKKDGTFLRQHNDKNTHQHEATLKAFENYPEEWQSYLQWFYTLKLFFDTRQLRAVHACWDYKHIKWLTKKNYFVMSEELLVLSHQKKKKAYRVMDEILKGKEFAIPAKYVWKDKDGHERKKNRIKWWKDPNNSSYNEFLFNCPEELKEKMINRKIDAVIYHKNDPPVFFGHYWLEDPFPNIRAENVICLDYSIAKKGNLVAYRWNGEQKLNKRNFVAVNYKEE